jgi:hypothetical protein
VEVILACGRTVALQDEMLHGAQSANPHALPMSVVSCDVVQDDPRFQLADPICTFLFALLVLWTTRLILQVRPGCSCLTHTVLCTLSRVESVCSLPIRSPGCAPARVLGDDLDASQPLKAGLASLLAGHFRHPDGACAPKSGRGLHRD